MARFLEDGTRNAGYTMSSLIMLIHRKLTYVDTDQVVDQVSASLADLMKRGG
jgi:hypothetical protein